MNIEPLSHCICFYQQQPLETTGCIFLPILAGWKLQTAEVQHNAQCKTLNILKLHIFNIYLMNLLCTLQLQLWLEGTNIKAQ